MKAIESHTSVKWEHNETLSPRHHMGQLVKILNYFSFKKIVKILLKYAIINADNLVSFSIGTYHSNRMSIEFISNVLLVYCLRGLRLRMYIIRELPYSG